MRSRLVMLITLVTVALMVGGLWLATGEGFVREKTDDQGQTSSTQKKQRKKDASQPKPAERSLAFDVTRRDYKNASKYVLEITSAAGSVTTHDVKKPRRQQGTITVPLPVLAPGKYQVIVVAEGTVGKSRSVPLQMEIK